jgi:hypothetical protein
MTRFRALRLLTLSIAGVTAAMSAGCSPAPAGTTTPRSTSATTTARPATLEPGTPLIGTAIPSGNAPESTDPAGAATKTPLASIAHPSPTATPAGTPIPDPPSPGAPPALHVEGNQLVDAAGATVLLHGVDMSGTESVCAQNWTTDPFGGQPEDDAATFAAMRSWDINAVRIPLNEDCWLGINGVEIGGTAYQSAIVHLVNDLQAAGLYVILDLHWSAPGSQLAFSQNPAPDEDHSPAFWSSVATTFGEDGGVLFDLYNEPYFYWLTSGENQWQCLWQGCTLTEYVTGSQPYTVTTNWSTAGFDQLTTDIRSAGASNVIMAGCVDWANNCSGWASSYAQWGSDDANTVVAWHSYPGESCDTESCWNSTIAPLAADHPIVVGETGDSSAGPETFLPTFLPWADAHGVSYLAWTWNAWEDADDVLVTSMTDGTPTAGEGAYYQQHLLSLG